MEIDIEVAKALAPGLFTFAGVIVALLWNDRRERREREKRHAHEANMLRRVMTADLEIAKHNATAAANFIRKATKPQVTIDLPKVRNYSTEQFGMLTVVEIEPVFVAIAAIETLRTMIEHLAVARKGEAFTLQTAHVAQLVGSFDGLVEFCKDAIAELKAETGP